jgi:hypothetical protein
MHTLYRICTENVPGYRDKILEALEHFEVKAFAVLDGLGYWKGVPEKALVIEIVGPSTELYAATMRGIAWAIKADNGPTGQEAVLIQMIPLHFELI